MNTVCQRFSLVAYFSTTFQQFCELNRNGVLIGVKRLLYPHYDSFLTSSLHQFTSPGKLEHVFRGKGARGTISSIHVPQGKSRTHASEWIPRDRFPLCWFKWEQFLRGATFDGVLLMTQQMIFPAMSLPENTVVDQIQEMWVKNNILNNSLV